MLQILVYLIFFLGVINTLRMSIYFILGNIYDLKVLKKDKRRNKKYNPLISIVVPAFNEKESIYKCLESIYKSTYRNFQVIVANDGSYDNTAREVSRFIKSLKRRKLIYSKNKLV